MTRKLWLDVRSRFWICAVLVALSSLAPVVAFATLDTWSGWIELEPEVVGRLTDAGSDLGSWTRTGRGIGLLPYLAVVLAAGGVLTEGRSGTLLLMLSLPVSRRRWLLAQWASAATLIALLAALSALILITASRIIGSPLPVAPILGTAGLSAVAGLWPIGLTLLATTWTLDVARPMLVAAGSVFVVANLGAYPGFEAWSPWAFAHLATWTADGLPWQSLLSLLFLSIAPVLLALYRFDRLDT